MDSDVKQLLRSHEDAQKQFEKIVLQYETTGTQLATHLSHIQSIQADVRKTYNDFDSRIGVLEKVMNSTQTAVQIMNNGQDELLKRLEEQSKNHKEEIEQERKKNNEMIAQLRKEREQDRAMFDKAFGQIITKLNGIEQQNTTMQDMMGSAKKSLLSSQDEAVTPKKRRGNYGYLQAGQKAPLLMGGSHVVENELSIE
jgi:chromosome segregation ATPase